MNKYLVLILLFGSHVSILGQSFNRIETTSQLIGVKNTTGVSIADYDGDNDLDVFIVGKHDYSPLEATTWSKLFSNNNDGTFSDVTIEAGFGNLHNFDIEDPGWQLGVKMGASWGDYDNDGNPDLFLTNYQSFQLFKNRGDGTFTDVTVESGIPAKDSCYNYTSLWWDFDSDGYLDLFVPNWIGCTRNKYFKNDGDGTFTEVAEELNLTGNKHGSLMSVPLDANYDGLWDLYIANDFSNNELYIQNIDGTFTDKASEYGIDYQGNDMGIAIGDYDNNGLYDIYITNIAENRFASPNGSGTYDNISAEKNILNTYWGWDARFTDFDLDGDEDLFVLNGFEKDVVHFSILKENFYFKNLLMEGSPTFEDHSIESGVHEFSNSLSMGVFDFDNDGDHDVLVSNSDETPFFYENRIINETNPEELNWVSFRLEGTVSNRDGLGSQMTLWHANQKQNRFYYGAGFLSQSLQAVHFGLGSSTKIDSIEIEWDTGLKEKFYDLESKTHYQLTEGSGIVALQLNSEKKFGCTDPASCNFDQNATVDNGTCTYLDAPIINGNIESGYLKTESYSCINNSESTYHWSIENGEIISGQGTNEIRVRWELEEQGILVATEINVCESIPDTLEVRLSIAHVEEQHSVARLWNEALLLAIRNDFARPTVHARNLYHTSLAMYDAWAVYDSEARPFLLGNMVHGYMDDFSDFSTTQEKESAINESISYAAFRILHHRFLQSPSYVKSRNIFNRLFEELGYDRSFTSVDYHDGNPAALGNYIAQTIIEYGMQDGATELQQYANAYYTTVNPPLVTNDPGNTTLLHPNRWQPLALETFIDQAGNLIDGSTPEFLSPEWGNVAPFSLNESNKKTFVREENTYNVYHDPGLPPLLDTTSINISSDQYKSGFSMVSVWGAHLSPDDDVLWDISPQKIGNISSSEFPKSFSDFDSFYNYIEGGDIGTGRSINPITNAPYPANNVYRGDYTRVLAEFWADGPDSETPPGHWFVLLNNVSDNPQLEKKLQGVGLTLSNLEWDVKSYFIMGGTMHDAAISAWSIKGWYDYIRPISAIRYLAERGQSSKPELESYDIGGIPLMDGYIEIVESGDDLQGIEEKNVGKVKLYTWRGHDFISDTETDEAGVGWILAEDWVPYQRPSFVTPPFAGYVSGHSTYSRAAAEVMTLLTGSEYFPGGVGEFVAHKNEFLVFEEGPSQDVILQWATYRDASDQCSLSRIWGGIHPPADDIPGRIIGEQIGKEAFEFAIPYFSKINSVVDKSTIINNLYPNPTVNGESVTLMNTNSHMKFQLIDSQGKSSPISNYSFNPQCNCTSIDLGNIVQGMYVISAYQRSWKVLIIE